MQEAPKLKVFVSCVEDEFRHEVKAVRHMLREIGLEVIERKTDTIGLLENFIEIEREYVRQCDLFIGIYGSAYGGFSDNPDQNWIEIGYRTAEELQKPVLAFFQDVRQRDDSLSELLYRISTRRGAYSFNSEKDLIWLWLHANK